MIFIYPLWAFNWLFTTLETSGTEDARSLLNNLDSLTVATADFEKNQQQVRYSIIRNDPTLGVFLFAFSSLKNHVALLSEVACDLQLSTQVS